MSSSRGLLIRLTARRIFYTGPGKETAPTACSAVKSTAIAPNPHNQVPQRASNNGDVGPLMRAAKSHLIRTGRFPSFAELKAELCKATAATGGSDHNHAAALLRAATKSSTPPLPSQGPPSSTLPRPPPVTRLPFHDDPPPRLDSNPGPARAAANRAPAAERATQQPSAQASSARRPIEGTAASGADGGAVQAVVHAMGTGESSLQLLPAGGAAKAVSPVVAAPPPAAGAASTSMVVSPAESAVSRVEPDKPTDSLAKHAEPARASDDLPGPPHNRGPDDMARGGANGWRDRSHDHWRKGNYYLLLITVALVTLACIERRLQQHAREVETAEQRRFDRLQVELERKFDQLAVQQQHLVGVAMAQWAAAHDEELRRASEELVSELAARRR